MASLGYSANYNVVNIPRSRSHAMFDRDINGFWFLVFGPLRLRHVNDSVPQLVVLDKIRGICKIFVFGISQMSYFLE